MRQLNQSFAVALFCLSLTAGPAFASSADEHANHQPMQHKQPEGSAVHFADVTLVDQNERPVHLKDDLVKDRIVVMTFIYTSCTTVCPVVSAIMQKVQAQLGERLEDEVQLVSISVDPLRDTPDRLREYAQAFKSGPSWSWLTGSPQAVKNTLMGLGTWSADIAEHQPVIMVGDGNSEHWMRYYGFTDPAVLVDRVEALSAARSHSTHHASLSHGAHP